MFDWIAILSILSPSPSWKMIIWLQEEAEELKVYLNQRENNLNIFILTKKILIS